MLQNKNDLTAAARPQPMANVDTPDMLAFAPPQMQAKVGGMAPPVQARRLAPPVAPMSGSEPSPDEETPSPLVSPYVLRNSNRTSLAPLIDAEVQKRVAAAQAMSGIQDVPKLISPYVQNMANTSHLYSMGIPMAVPETPEEELSGIPWFISRTGEGIRNVPGQVAAEIANIVSTPWYFAAMVENYNTGRTDGKRMQQAQAMREGVQRFRDLGAPERDPEQSTMSKLGDPGIVIPAIASFGTQIATMFVGGGVVARGAGLLTKGQMSTKTANRIATAAGGIWGGNVEGQHTYFEAIERGMTPGEASLAFAKHASISGGLSMTQLSFLFNTFPAPLQQKLVRRVAAGGWDSVTETLDETAGAWSLDPDISFKEAMQVTKDAFGEIGTAAFIVGMVTGGMGLPPEMALKAARAGEVESQIDFTLQGGKSVMDEVGEERLKHVLQKEADWFRTADGTVYSTVDIDVRTNQPIRGDVIDGDLGSYWISGRYGQQDGELLPHPLNEIVEVGVYGEGGARITTHGSETVQRMREGAKKTITELAGELPELRTTTFEEMRQREVALAKQRVAAEVMERIRGGQQAEFDRFAEELDSAVRAHEAAADNMRGVEDAVQSGLPEIGPDSAVADDVPVEVSDKMFAQLEKMAETEWQGKIGTANWLGLPADVRKKKKKETARRMAGLKGTVSRLQSQVQSGIAPAEPGTFAAEVEALVAHYALTGESTPIEQVMQEDFVAREMAKAEVEIEAKLRYIEKVSRKLSGGGVEDTLGNRYGLSAATFGPAVGGAPQVLTEADVAQALDRVDTGIAAAVDTSQPQTPLLTAGDYTRRLLQLLGGEDAMTSVMKGETTVKDVLMNRFAQGKYLKFIADTSRGSMVAAPWGAGVTSDTYNANLMAYVSAVRDAETALAYVMENKYSEEHGLRDQWLNEAGAMPPRPVQSGQAALFSEAEITRPLGSARRSTIDTHGFAATMKQSQLYNTLVRAGAELGWQDNYVAAELASEVVYAQANAWVAQDPGNRNVGEYYAKYLGELRATVETMTRAQHEIRGAAQGFAIPREMVPGAQRDSMFGIPNEMLFAEQPKAGTEQPVHQVFGAFDPSTKNIELFLGSDLHTVLHEFAHAWRQSLSPAQLKTAGRWANGKEWKPGQKWTRAGEERFANGFVTWAGSGKANVPKDVQDVFDGIGRYLTRLYNTGRAIRPDVRTSRALSDVMEKLITRQLLRAKAAEDREEGRRRQRQRAAFNASKERMNLGDHIDMMAEFLNMPPQSVHDKADLVREMESRKKNPKYRQELDAKLLEGEETKNIAIDLVDFMIVRDQAIAIRVKFEAEFAQAYRKGPEAVEALVTRMAKDRTEQDIRFYRLVAGDAGRRLSALRNKATQIDTAVLLHQVEREYGSKSFEILYQMMKDPKNAYKLAEDMAGEMAPTLWDLHMQAYFGFRLSSPDVLAVNFFGTGLWTMWNYTVHRPFAGAIDLTFKALSNVTSFGKVLDRFYFQGNPRARDHFNTSVLPLYAQLGRSVPYASRLAWDITKDRTGGVHTLASIKNMDISTRDVNSWQRFTLRRQGLTARVIRALTGEKKSAAAMERWENTVRSLGPVVAFSTTIMRASDMMFKVIAVEGEMNRIAQEEAAQMFPNNPTAQDGWIKTRTASIVNDPGQLTAAQADRMRQVAEYNTFTDMPLRTSRHIVAARETFPVIKWIFPYFNTLVNLGKRGLEMTPGVGLIAEGSYRFDPNFDPNSYGHTKADIIAKQLEGAVFVAMLFALFDEDEVTGAVPEDPQERKHFYEAGRIEYGVKIGDHWYSYANIQPFNVAFAITANLRKYVLANRDKWDSDAPDIQQKVNDDLMQAAWSIGTFLANSDFMRGFETLISARTTKERYRALGSVAENVVVPYNGLLRWMMRTENMMQNEEGHFIPQDREGMLETALPLSHNLMNKLFGLPLTEMNRITVWGEPYTYSDNKWYDSWLPVQYSKADQDAVDRTLEELQYMPTPVSRTYDINRKEYQFDREIWQQFALGYGQESKPAIARLIERPGFQRKHKEDKVVAIQAELRKIRSKHERRAKAAQRQLGLRPTGE